MTITQLSNLLNQVSQQIPQLRHYHCGLPSELEANIQNQPSIASMGKQYPALLFETPDIAVDPRTQKATSLLRLHFVDLQYYANNATTSNLTYLEQVDKLTQIAHSFVRAFMDYQRQRPSPSNLYLQSGAVVNYRHAPYQATNRLVLVEATVPVAFNFVCSPIVLDSSLISSPQNLTDDERI